MRATGGVEEVDKDLFRSTEGVVFRRVRNGLGGILGEELGGGKDREREKGKESGNRKQRSDENM